MQRSEVRDQTGIRIKTIFEQGEIVGIAKYFASRDHLLSIRSISDASGLLISSLQFDCFGEKSVQVGTVQTDYQYADLYKHERSGLNLAARRAFNSKLGRWTSREPQEAPNRRDLYGYVGNMPLTLIDPSGLDGAPTPSTTRPSPPAGISAGGSFLSRIRAMAGEAGLYFLPLEFLINAIEKLAKEKEQLEAGKKCVNDFKKGIDCCEEQYKKHKIWAKYQECKEEELKKLLQCLADNGFGTGETLSEMDEIERISKDQEERRRALEKLRINSGR